jgi:thiol-disulfide isomerase/thioredoxin
MTGMFSCVLSAAKATKFEERKYSFFPSSNKIMWARKLDVALRQAGKVDKLVLVNFYTDWCGFCRRMDQTTFTDKTVIQKMNVFVPVKINTEIEKKIAEEYAVNGLPTTVILDSKGRIILGSEGYMRSSNLVEMMNLAVKTITDLRQNLKELESDPNNWNRALEFAQKNLELQRFQDALPWLERIIKHAPKEQTDIHAWANFDLAIAKASMGNPIASVNYAETVMSIYSNHEAAGLARKVFPDILYFAGEKAQEQGDLKAAHAYYQRIVTEFPNSTLSKTALEILNQKTSLGASALELEISEWLRGKAISLQKLRGKVVLLDFFQIICPGCHRVHPHIVQMQEKYGKDDLQVIGIAVAFELQHIQKREDIRDFVKRTEFNYPVGIDKDFTKTFRVYKARGTPYAAIIDQFGNLKYLDFYNPIKIENIIQKLLFKDD